MILLTKEIITKIDSLLEKVTNLGVLLIEKKDLILKINENVYLMIKIVKKKEVMDKIIMVLRVTKKIMPIVIIEEGKNNFIMVLNIVEKGILITKTKIQDILKRDSKENINLIGTKTEIETGVMTEEEAEEGEEVEEQECRWVRDHVMIIK